MYPATSPQLTRLLLIERWLMEQRAFTRRHVAEATGVSVRTVGEDIRRLQEMGVPVEYQPSAHTYELTEPFAGLPMLTLTQSEWAAFLLAEFALEALGTATEVQHLREVQARLAQHLPPTVRVQAELLRQRLRVGDVKRPRAAPARWLNTLHQAADHQRVVHMRYYGNHQDEVTQRSVEPYLLQSRDGHWYLVGYCLLRKDFRTFRLDRIRSLKLSDEVFARMDEQALESYLNETFGVYADTRSYAVCIQFTAYQARWIKEMEWHPTQTLLERDDGALELRMSVTGLDDVTRWVLQYGAEAEVLSPPVLRQRVMREVERMGERYATSPTTSTLTSQSNR